MFEKFIDKLQVNSNFKWLEFKNRPISSQPIINLRMKGIILKPCPFCNHRYSKILRTIPKSNHEIVWFFRACTNCSMQGPKAKTEKEANIKWENQKGDFKQHLDE